MVWSDAPWRRFAVATAVAPLVGVLAPVGLAFAVALAVFGAFSLEQSLADLIEAGPWLAVVIALMPYGLGLLLYGLTALVLSGIDRLTPRLFRLACAGILSLLAIPSLVDVDTPIALAGSIGMIAFNALFAALGAQLWWRIARPPQGEGGRGRLTARRAPPAPPAAPTA